MNGRLSKIRSVHTYGLWSKVDSCFCEAVYSVLQLDAYFFILFYLCQIEISLGMLEKKIFGTSEYYQVYCLKLLAKYQQHCVMQKTSFSHSKLQVLTGCYVPKFKSDISQETEREASTTAKRNQKFSCNDEDILTQARNRRLLYRQLGMPIRRNDSHFQ